MKRILGFVLPLCAALTLSSCDKNEHYINDVVSYPESLVFDMGFDEVGRGYDRTGNLDVSTMTGAQLYATYNRHFEQYSSIFNTKAGLDNFESGYYRASYKGCEAFKKALGDGFSVELMFSPGQVENSVVMSARGFSVEILETEKDGKKGWNMRFTVKVDGKLYSTTTALYEDESIKTGTYYHVVAVWNILAAQTRIYVNNVGSTVCKNVAGTLDMGDELCIGSSYSSSRKVGQAFNGEIVWARIYDKSFYAEDVRQMFYTALYTGNEQQLSISDILYRTPCKVAPGNRYYVYGKGFEEGDSIAFRSSGAEEFRCCAEPHEFYNGVSVVLPEDLQSGVYEMTAFRGDVVKPLGIVSFELSETPDFGVKTKILAHRCAHDGESIPENSVAALKNAQDLGLWGAEFDLWITSPDEGVDNGVVVVNHDGKVSDKVLQNVKYSDLAGVTLSNGEPVATFESFLEQGKKTSIHLQFEIKEHSSPEAMNRCADEVVRLVEKYDYAPENFTITSNNYDVLKYLRDKEGIGATLRLAWQKPKSPEELEDLSMNSLSFGMMYYSLNPLWSARAEEMGMTSTAWLMPASEEDIVTAIGLGIGSITIEGKSDIERAKKLIERYVWLSEE